MNIRTMWGVRLYQDATPELMVAWDEYCVDENWDDWNEACQTKTKAWGSDLIERRFIDIYVPDSAIGKAFKTSYVAATKLTAKEGA